MKTTNIGKLLILLTAFITINAYAELQYYKVLPESYSRSVTGLHDYSRYPSPQPLYALSVNRTIDNVIHVAIEPVDGSQPEPQPQPEPICDIYEGTTKAKVKGLLDRINNFLANGNDVRKLGAWLESMYADVPDMQARLNSLYKIYNGGCDEISN